jgi:hypothetical protein
VCVCVCKCVCMCLSVCVCVHACFMTCVALSYKYTLTQRALILKCETNFFWLIKVCRVILEFHTGNGAPFTVEGVGGALSLKVRHDNCHILLHCRYTFVTLSLHCRCTVFTLSLHCRCTVVALSLHCRYTAVTQNCLMGCYAMCGGLLCDVM